MRFIEAVLTVVVAFHYNGCTDKGNGGDGADEAAEEELEDYTKPDGKKGGNKIAPNQIRPGEKAAIAEGCQQYVYKGGNSDLFDRIDRSPKCYTPAGQAGASPIEVTVYYQRHGQSTWNVEHMHYGFRDHDKNTDAHLTTKGVQQALDAHEAIERNRIGGDVKDKEILTQGSYKDERVIFATSNLRRAVLTFLVTFRHLLKSMKKLYIVSALQELADNTDSDPLAGPREIPKLTFSKSISSNSDPSNPDCPFKENNMKKLMDVSCNDGNERKFPSRPHINWYNLLESQKTASTIDHINHLCTWMYNIAGFGEDYAKNQSPKPSLIPTNFVFTGHSMYLRTFFDNFIDSGRANKVEGKISSSLRRLQNGSIFRFKLRLVHDATTNTVKCSIVPSTTESIYGKISWRVR